MRNKTTEVTEGHREGVFGIAEYVHEEVAFVQVNYAQFLSIVLSFHEITAECGASSKAFGRDREID